MFIEFTLYSNEKRRVLLNPSQIAAVSEDQYGITVVSLFGGNNVQVKQSIEDVVSKLESVQKADRRLMES